MFKSLWQHLEERERTWRRSFGMDITDPAERRKSRRQYLWIDHAILRSFWTNEAELAPGVWRSNQPTHRRFEDLKARGVTTILNLRGPSKYSMYLFEEESCQQLGLTLVDIPLRATKPPSKEGLVSLLDTFDQIDPPFLMHCKSGSDRTGLAAVIWLHLKEGWDLDAAQEAHLSFKFLHRRNAPSGILDHMLDMYRAAKDADPALSLDHWIRHHYDPEALGQSFAKVYPRRRS